jgi:hypothetical protein
MEVLNKKICIAPHQGLGDILLCIGMFRYLASNHKELRIIVTLKNRVELERILGPHPSITYTCLPTVPRRRPWSFLELLLVWAALNWLQFCGFKKIALGYLGRNFLDPGSTIRFDENFYSQAAVPFETRWTYFKVERNEAREDYVYDMLNPSGQEYVFLHEDRERGFVIDRGIVPQEKKIIEPLPPEKGLAIADYVKLLVRASEIHVIESSFAALIEGLDVQAPKFAHRYARPEASNDPLHEFTYRTDWNVAIKPSDSTSS